MPTIKELDAALAAADDDLIPISQAGIARWATRAQMVAGLQRTVVLSPGLLGRSSAGLGGPERIGVGANLRLQGGVLSGPAPFSVAGLPGGVAPGVMDLFPTYQGGRDSTVPYGALMAGLGGLAGIDLSAHRVRLPGGAGRSLWEWMADAAPVEAFGALGNGVADDTAAFDRAVASGRPVRLGAKTYVVNGQWTVTRSATLIGVPGRSVLRRISQSGGAWISVQAPAFTALGVTFDAGRLNGESWGVLVTPQCTETLFEHCVFRGATGATLGSGLTIQARDGQAGNAANNAGNQSRHRVLGCEAADNRAHGIWIQAAAGALVEGCLLHGNGAYGVCLDFNDPNFSQTVRGGRVLGCRAWGNARGISVGNYNETNREPPRWGNLNPDAADVLVQGNVCEGNSAYGIAVAGRGIQVLGNHVVPGPNQAAGILLNAVLSRVCGNVITGSGGFGIDAGGCIECDVSDNLVQGCATGINPGGSRGMRVSGNQLVGNVWAITVYDVETDGAGQNFGMATQGMTIEGNRITLRDGSGGGIFLIDAPQGVVVARNAFFPGAGSSPSQALWAHTDGMVVRDNVWDNQARTICNPVNLGAVQQVQVPDMLDEAMLTSAPRGVTSIMGQHQASMAGRVAFVRVTSGGGGYTRAAVSITGAGAQATAYLRDGRVIGVAMQSNGAGYGAGLSPVTVSIAGDGQGAAAVATVGLPVPEGRRLRLHCNGAVRFQRAGSVPFQDNWTGADILVPAASAVEWVGAWGGWQALGFQSADYLAPPGDGSLVVRTQAGDLVLHPAGRVRVGSDTEPFGYAATLGRGSPEGVVAAPPGSDYRNLNGGAGATLWVKRTGTGPVGWFALA